MRLKLLLLTGIAALLLSPSTGQAQPGGKGRMGGDPAAFFKMMTGGKDVWIRSEITDPRRQNMFDMIAQGQGITSGQMTFEQFQAGMQNMKSQWGNKGGKGGPKGGGPPGPPGDKSTPGGEDAWLKWVESSFKSRDRNGDGVLNRDEVPGQLRNEFDKWDTNKDGVIDLKEYTEYMRARMQQRDDAKKSYTAPLAVAVEDETDVKPVVYRAGNLPKEIPDWFAQLDTDKDGQISLMEWKKSGKSYAEFKELDRNNDGFITVEEVLFALKLTNKGKGGIDVASGDDPSSQFNREIGGGDRRPPNMGKGPPGGGKKGPKGKKGGG
jgi:Ca2+-binding EF-hand superfamily protein